jgi:Uma2 family endonuclease
MNMAQPSPVPSSGPEPQLYTVTEYLGMGEFEPGYAELSEGRLMMTPSPAPRHNRAGFRVALLLDMQMPADFVVVQDVDLDLELAPVDRPGFVRRPDLIVTSRSVLARIECEGGAIRASEVVLVVEIVSPGSVRTDNVVKRGEYADAGVPHYWIVDLSDPVSVLVCHQAGAFGYADGGAVTGTLRVTEPFTAEIVLDDLLR